MTSRNLPYSIEAEEALLGNILVYPQSLEECMEAGIASDDFYLDRHVRIYSIIANMYDAHKKVDIVSLSSALKDYDYFEKVGGMDYLIQLTSTTVDSVNTREYISIVKNNSLARQIIKAGEQIADEAVKSSSGIDDLLDNAEKKILDITRSRTDADFKKGSDVFEEAVRHIEKIQESGSAITGIKTLYSGLDKMTAGFQRGDLIILAARPSMGKTALALNIALNAASVSQGAVAIFSLEMPAEQLAMRMFAAKSKVDSQKIRTGRLSDGDWSRINETVQELKRQKFFIDDTSGIKVGEMYAKCRKLKNDNGLALVVVDYIQLIQANANSDSRQQEISDISRRLKAMARDLEVPVIALSQLSRLVERRENKRPMLSDLRESGALEQDADLVLFIYRDDYYERNEDKQEEREDVELIIAKHRNGPTGTVRLAFERDINAFYSVANAEE